VRVSDRVWSLWRWLATLSLSRSKICISSVSNYFLVYKDQPISLGWGTKATQFHGSLGKSAAQASQTSTHENDTKLGETPSDAYEISWRGDGAFFAVTCPARKSDQSFTSRLVKVYSRSGALSSSSEAIPNSRLGDKIAWRPEGSIIASSVRDLQKDQLNIIFFERNGLQRYGFDLNEVDSIVNIWGLSWNSDSSILAVGIEKHDKSPSSDHSHKASYAGEF
jgi:elongator complex protein 1